MTDNIININEVIGLEKIRRKINSYDLSKVTFVKDGKVIEASVILKEHIEDWKFIGLNNFDFVLMTDFDNTDSYKKSIKITEINID